jgi:YfiR/HmsC-like
MISKLPIHAVLLLVLLLVTGQIARAGDDLLPGKQAALLLRVLPYDQNFAQRAQQAVTVAVVYREGNLISETYSLDIGAALKDIARGMQVKDLPVRVVTIAYSNSETLAAALAKQKLSALYVCPGLEDALDSISDLTRKNKILTFSGTESEVRDRISIGLLRRGSRPALIVNLRAAIAEGADLSPDLLSLSEVLR